MKRQLIITGDDFGFSSERNSGILEAYGNGALTCASLLLNCTGTQDAVDRAKETNLLLGLHLNLTEGSPVGRKEYNTLTSSGIFQGRCGTRDSLNKGKIDVAEIKEEIEAQINLFEKLCGSKPTYVDGHQHIHLHPVIAPLFSDALKRHGIFATRLPLEVNLSDRTWLSPDWVEMLNAFLSEANGAAAIFQKAQIRTSQCFVGLSTMGSYMTATRLQELISEAFETVESKDPERSGSITCELMTHPGHPTPTDFGGFSWGTDDFGASTDRVHEIQVLSSDAMKNFYQSQKINLISYKELD